jgi:hypothetical protein
MVNRKSVAAVFGVAVLVLATAVPVNAWGTAKRTTYLTFSGPFALPGVSLPAGTYIFERADVNTPDIVRVTSRDGSHVYLTAFTRIVPRPNGLHRDRQVSFGEVGKGVTPPVTTWYPIGGSIGHQFIYPDNSRQLTGRAGN